MILSNLAVKNNKTEREGPSIYYCYNAMWYPMVQIGIPKLDMQNI